MSAQRFRAAAYAFDDACHYATRQRYRRYAFRYLRYATFAAYAAADIFRLLITFTPLLRRFLSYAPA